LNQLQSEQTAGNKKIKLNILLNDLIMRPREEQTQNLKSAFCVDYQEIISQISKILEDVYGRNNKDKILESMGKLKKIAFKV
jgi:hypothetical protein